MSATFKDKNILRHNAISTVFFDHPVPINHTMLTRTRVQDNEIINYFLQLKENGSPDRTSNLTGWKTPWDTHKQHKEILNDLINEIIDFHINVVMDPRPVENQEGIKLDAEIWFAEYLENDCAQEHNHTWATRTSFVYYLGCDDHASALTFCQKHWRSQGQIDTVRELDLKVIPGMLVMFPGFINHMVKPTKGKRYVIAGNINDISIGV